MTVTEAELRERYPEIRWDEPVLVRVGSDAFFVCRYCIAMQGLRAADLVGGLVDAGFPIQDDAEHGYGAREQCRGHIGQAHH